MFPPRTVGILPNSRFASIMCKWARKICVSKFKLDDKFVSNTYQAARDMSSAEEVAESWHVRHLTSTLTQGEMEAFDELSDDTARSLHALQINVQPLRYESQEQGERNWCLYSCSIKSFITVVFAGCEHCCNRSSSCLTNLIGFGRVRVFRWNLLNSSFASSTTQSQQDLLLCWLPATWILRQSIFYDLFRSALVLPAQS